MITIFFVVVTCIISILAFSNGQVFSKLQFNPYQVYHRKEYYRLLSHGFIHADWWHLIINMFVLFSFGRVVESYFQQLAEEGVIHFPNFWFSFLYLAAIVVSSLTTLIRYKNNIMYNSVGASGGVSAVLFCSIFFHENR